MIKRIEKEKDHKGARYDPASGKYVSYKIDIEVGGVRMRPGGFSSRKEAKKFIEDARASKRNRAAGIRSSESPLVSELFSARLARIKNKHERVRAERVFATFRSNLTGDPKVIDITRGDFQLFINQRELSVKKETVNREINLLSKAFNDAPAMFPKILDDYEPPKIPRPKFKRKRREKIITPKEKDAILAELYKPQGDESDAAYKNRIRIGRMFHIAYMLGMAYKEVATLMKSEYNGEGLTFTRDKSGNDVSFEWLPIEVHELLKDAIAESDTEFVFTHSGSTPKNFYDVMKKAVTDAGLVYGRDDGITFHSARHSFVTRAMQHGDLKTVGSMSGHSDDVMVMLYTHATPESRKKVLQSMHAKIDLREIFEQVRAGEMSYEDFERAVK